MNKKISQNEFEDLIITFHDSLKALQASSLVSMDFASKFQKTMFDPLKEYSQNNKIVIMMKIMKILLITKNQKKYLVLTGKIIGENINHTFRPFKIIFKRYLHFIKVNIIPERCYIFSNLCAKILRRDFEKTKELTFEASKTTQCNFFLKKL